LGASQPIAGNEMGWVFYDVSGTTVEVLAIVAKSEAESWLAQFASPE
jgi:hypothetical protein